MADVINLGPELFATSNEKVICWRGDYYHKSCGVLVYTYPKNDPSGLAQSHCVKRVDHPSRVHEDYEGRTRADILVDFSNYTLEAACTEAIKMACNAVDDETLEFIAQMLIKRMREFGPIYG